MKRPVAVSMAFLRYAYADKVVFGDKVIKLLTLNALKFPELPSSVILLKGFNDNLRTAITNQITGGKIEQKHLQSVTVVWNTNYKLVAKYINVVCNGDEELIAESGFPSTKGDILPLPKNNSSSTINVSINDGQKGGFDVSSDKDKNAAGHLYFSMPVDATCLQNGDTMEITISGETIYIQPRVTGVAVFENMPSHVPQNVTTLSFNTKGCNTASPIVEVTPQ